MEERRKSPRIKDENEVTITVFSEENNIPKEKIIENFTKDISAGGAKLQTNILMPVDTLIELEFTPKGLRQQINAIGKVKWVKVLIDDESYQAGVEFSGPPNEAVSKLQDYISWKLKSHKVDYIKEKLSPVDSGDVNIEKKPEIAPIDPAAIEITKDDTIPRDQSGQKDTEKIKREPRARDRKWIAIPIFVFFVLVLAAVLLQAFGVIPSLNNLLYPETKLSKTAIKNTEILQKPAVESGVPAENLPAEAPAATEPVSEETVIKNMLDKWINSWKSGDMEAYRSCYAPDFRSKEKDLNAWITHKANIFKNSKDIAISINDVRIHLNGDSAKVLFIQQYSSSLIKSSGKKILHLKKTDNGWRIHKELIRP